MKNTEYFLIVLNVPMIDSEYYHYIPKPNKGFYVNLQRHQKDLVKVEMLNILIGIKSNEKLSSQILTKLKQKNH